VASQGIEFAEDVVQEKQWVEAAALLDQLVARQAKGEG
jgi:hypothetical protein